jgi:zinc transport system ATP-binding protein
MMIDLHNLSFSYPNSPSVLENINLSIEQGEFLGIVGPNGGGKTTLLKLILGLLKPTQGTISIKGLSPIKGREWIGYVPQFANFSRDYPISVMQAILLGRLGKTKRFFGYCKTDYQIAERVMQETYLTDLKHRALNTLSGGQLQRVLIARALACEPEILILDEPTANIDMRVEEDIFDLLKILNQRLSILVVSHDIGFISGYVKKVACLNKTLICHSTEELTPNLIQNLYSNQTIHAIQHLHSH